MSSARARAAAEYYGRFSFEVGLRDWLTPNPRHEQLKLIVDELLEGARGVRILDVGCGAGVLARHLTRFGHVTGVDVSEPAIVLARDLAPEVTFRVGTLDAVPSAHPFDLVTLFDVLEHIPTDERARFFSAVRARLAPDGRILASTPHPAQTRWLREHRPELLQIVDDPVELRAVLELAEPLGLELVHYRTFDVDRGPREYQLLLLGRVPPPGGSAVRNRRFARRMVMTANPGARFVRRARIAARLLRARGRPWATSALLGRADPPQR